MTALHAIEDASEELQVGYDIYTVKSSLSSVLRRMEKLFAGRTDEGAELSKIMACYCLQQLEQLDVIFSTATRNGQSH